MRGVAITGGLTVLTLAWALGCARPEPPATRRTECRWPSTEDKMVPKELSIDLREQLAVGRVALTAAEQREMDGRPARAGAVAAQFRTDWPELYPYLTGVPREAAGGWVVCVDVPGLTELQLRYIANGCGRGFHSAGWHGPEHSMPEFRVWPVGQQGGITGYLYADTLPLALAIAEREYRIANPTAEPPLAVPLNPPGPDHLAEGR